MEAATNSRRPLTGWLAIARFGLYTLSFSLIASLAFTPWLDTLNLSWWKVFRRCVSLAAAASLWLCLRQEGRSLASYGFSTWSGAGKRELVTGLLVGIACLAGLFGIGLLFGFYQVDITQDRAKLWRTVIGFIPAAALVAMLEEAIFRGFLLQQLLAGSKTVAIFVSSALYSVVHLRTPLAELSTWMELGGLFLLGVVLSLSYLKTNRLLFAVGLHGALAYGARVNKLFIGHPYPELSWLIGTGRLVNGLIGWVALLGLGGWIGWRSRRIDKGGGRHVA